MTAAEELNQEDFLLERRQFTNQDPVRSEYDRDEARVIHSAAFRRLQSKTQVLGLGESDFYRTRLTHSMEVAQIGRGLVQYLKENGDRETKIHLPCTSLISAICLAHDIGHPPFGHGGEVALNYCMRDYGGFEGNGQTLRILSKLEKYTDGFGINPTRRMLLGVLKYPVSYSRLVNPEFYNEDGREESQPWWLFKAKNQKPPKCYHDWDQDIIDFVFKEFDPGDVEKFTKFETAKDKHSSSLYKSLDCSIMNLADNISYSLHDLEDALSLNMITRNDWDSHFDKKDHLFDDYLSTLNGDSEETVISIVKSLFGASYKRKRTIGSLVNYLITNSEIFDSGSECNEPQLRLNVKLKDEAEALRKHIFDLVKNKVILDANVQQLEFKGQKIVSELFQVIAKDPERFLPQSPLSSWKNARSKAEKYMREKLSSEESRSICDDDKMIAKTVEEAGMRVICDYISGMTDDYATRLYEKMFSPSKGSIFERL